MPTCDNDQIFLPVVREAYRAVLEFDVASMVAIPPAIVRRETKSGIAADALASVWLVPVKVVAFIPRGSAFGTEVGLKEKSANTQKKVDRSDRGYGAADTNDECDNRSTHKNLPLE